MAKKILPDSHTKNKTFFPVMTKDEVAAFKKATEAKQHAEYLCYMMLNELNNRVSLVDLLRYAVSKDMIDRDTLEEFCGTDDEAGCCSVEGFTIEGLLHYWQTKTDAMTRTVTDARRNTH